MLKSIFKYFRDKAKGKFKPADKNNVIEDSKPSDTNDVTEDSEQTGENNENPQEAHFLGALETGKAIIISPDDLNGSSEASLLVYGQSSDEMDWQ